MKNNKTNHNQIFKRMACVFACLLILINLNPIKTYAEDTTENDYESALIILSLMNANGIYIDQNKMTKDEYYSWWDIFCLMSEAGILQISDDLSIKNLIKTTIQIPTATWIANGLKEEVAIKSKNIVNVIDWLASKIKDYCKEKNLENWNFNVKIYKYQMYQDKEGYNSYVEFIKWLYTNENLIEFGTNKISLGVTYTNEAYLIRGINSTTGNGEDVTNPGNILLNKATNKIYVYNFPNNIDFIFNVFFEIIPDPNATKYEITWIENNYTDRSYSHYQEIIGKTNDKQKFSSTYGNLGIKQEYEIPEKTILFLKVGNGKLNSIHGVKDYGITEPGTYEIMNDFTITGIKEEEKTNGTEFDIGNILGYQLDLITDNQFIIMDYLNIIAEEGLYGYETLLDIDKTLMEILYAQSTGETYNFNNEKGGIQYNYVNCNIYDNTTNQTTNLTNNYIQNTNTQINNSYQYIQNIEQNIMNYINNNFGSIDIKGEEYQPNNEITNGLSLIKSTIEQTYSTMKDNNLSMPLYLSMILSFILMVIK